MKMRKIIMGKRAIAPLFIILFIILGLLVIYLFLFFPLPAFTKIRTIINYFLILIFWIILQVGFVYGYVKLGSFAIKGFYAMRTKITNWSMKIHKLIAVHT
jgi:hypothetical protein